MGELIYKHLPPHYGKKSCVNWVPYLREDDVILFSSAEHLNDCFECRIQSLEPPMYWDQMGVVSSYGGMHNYGKLLLSQRLRQDNFILSMNSAYHSSSMWARYSCDHTGVCIGFDSAHSFFQGCEDKIIRISSLQPVKYRTEPPLINKNKLDDVLFTKSVEFLPSLLKDFLRKRSDEMGVPLKYAVPSHTSFRIEKVDTDPRP
jgi:hypothetical protein